MLFLPSGRYLGTLFFLRSKVQSLSRRTDGRPWQDEIVVVVCYYFLPRGRNSQILPQINGTTPATRPCIHHDMYATGSAVHQTSRERSPGSLHPRHRIQTYNQDRKILTRVQIAFPPCRPSHAGNLRTPMYGRSKSRSAMNLSPSCLRLSLPRTQGSQKMIGARKIKTYRHVVSG